MSVGRPPCLWQQQSPYLNHDLTQGLFTWSRRCAIDAYSFGYYLCRLDTSLGDFQAGDLVTYAYLDFQARSLHLSSGDKQFVGVLGWGLWDKARCVWQADMDDTNDSLPFEAQEMAYEDHQIHYWSCRLHHALGPWSRGDVLPRVTLDWSRRIMTVWDQEGRDVAPLWQGRLGYSVLRREPHKETSVQQQALCQLIQTWILEETDDTFTFQPFFQAGVTPRFRSDDDDVADTGPWSPLDTLPPLELPPPLWTTVPESRCLGTLRLYTPDPPSGPRQPGSLLMVTGC